MKRIPLTQGKFALVDDSDFEYLMQWKWHVRKDCHTYYASVNTPHRRGKLKRWQIGMHVMLMNPPKGYVVDHIDHNGLNNQRSNLRICTALGNAQHAKIRKDNTSGFKGVSWHKPNKQWIVYINVSKNRIFIGGFKDKIKAAKAYNRAAKKYHGEFAFFNPL